MEGLKLVLCIFILSISSFATSNSLVGSKCKTKDNEDGICKNYKVCPHLFINITSREEYQEVIRSGGCDRFGIVCCPSIPSTTKPKIKGEISKRSELFTKI